MAKKIEKPEPNETPAEPVLYKDPDYEVIVEAKAARQARLDAIIHDMGLAEMTHHPQAIRLLIKSVVALVEEIR